MEYTEFRRHVGKAGLTINEFSSLIDVRASSVSNYARKHSVPKQYAIIAVLLGDAADRGQNFRDLLIRFGLPIGAKTSTGKKVARLDEFRKRPALKSKP